MKIKIETIIDAALETVWEAWTTPESITKWNFASPEWHCPKATIELEKDKRFNYRMEAKDGSMAFDFEGTFLSIALKEEIVFSLDDNRKVWIRFEVLENKVKITEIFEAEDENSAQQQKQGWQMILNNFKNYVEKTKINN